MKFLEEDVIEHQLLRQHIQDSAAAVATSDGDLLLKAARGVVQGSSVATGIFNRCVMPVVEALQEEIELLDEHLCLKNPIDGSKQTISDTWFVDDLGMTMCSKKPEELQIHADSYDSFIVGEMTEEGLILNFSKTESVARFAGEGSQAVSKKYFEENIHGISKHCRYLGQRIHWNGSHTNEISLRIQATWNCWHVCSKYWCRNVPVKHKSLMIKSVLVSTLLSGLETAVVSKHDTEKLESCMMKMCRAALRGEATIKVLEFNKMKFAAMAGEKVRQKLQLNSVRTELLVMSLKRLQTVVGEPQNYSQWITAFLVR